MLAKRRFVAVECEEERGRRRRRRRRQSLTFPPFVEPKSPENAPRVNLMLPPYAMPLLPRYWLGASKYHRDVSGMPGPCTLILSSVPNT